jgi:hypothetical protein
LWGSSPESLCDVEDRPKRYPRPCLDGRPLSGGTG